MLGLSDWAASGLARTPGVLAIASLAFGALAGAICGVVAVGLGRARLGVGLVLAGGIALEGVSVASKELEGAGALPGAALALVLALLTLVLVVRDDAVRSPARTWNELGFVALLPAGAWLAAHLGADPWLRVAVTGLPLVALALERSSRGRASSVTLAVVPVALLVAAQLESGFPRRAELPDPPAPVEAHPSVVVLVIDTLRADALSPDGALAAFAREGVEFRQCVSAAPWTLPAVSSLLTGLYPSQHGAVGATTALADDVTTLAELLRDAGYATGAFTGGAFVGAAHHLDQGFQVFDSTCERRFEPFVMHTPLVWRLAKNRYWPLPWLVRAVDEFRGLAGVLDAAKTWAARAGSRPKLLFLHTYQVHDYYLYDPDVDDEVRARGPAPSAEFAGRATVNPRELAHAAQSDLDYFHALYRQRVAAVEHLFPELVAELTPLVGADAVWVVTADHGEGFDAAHGRVHHGGRLHEDLLRVPLVVRAPGRLAPGRVVEESVRSVDVLPTVLDLVGVALPERGSGESLLPALRGERSFPGSAFSEEHAPGYDLIALRRDGWKVIQSPHQTALFHLAEDPLELAPVSGELPAELRAELTDFPVLHPAHARAGIELDPATHEQLRSLGYVH